MRERRYPSQLRLTPRAAVLGPNVEASSEALARTLARQRSQAPIPRLSRMRLADRERAYAYLEWPSCSGLERCRRRAELSQTEVGRTSLAVAQAVGLIELGQRKPYDGMAQKAAVRDRTRASRGSPRCSSVLNILPALQGFSVFSPLEQ